MVAKVILYLYVFHTALGSSIAECSDQSVCKQMHPGTADTTTLLQNRVHVAPVSDAYSTMSEKSNDPHLAKLSEAQALSRQAGASRDPFTEVPSQVLQDAVRAGLTYSKVPMPSHPKVMQTSLMEEAGEATEAWSDEALKQALTSVQCRGSQHNRSCAFENLYFNQDEGGFFVFSLTETVHPDFNSVLLVAKWHRKGSIKRRDFKSLAKLREFLQGNRPKVQRGLSLVYDSFFHFNIAHALWDGLYPAFLALCEFGRHTETFRSVVGIPPDCMQHNTEDGKCMSEGVFRKFGGGEFVPYAQLNGTGWHCFADSVAGSGHKGQRSINRDYALPGGRSLDGARLFRDRMYTSHGLEVPKAQGQARPLRGIVIGNKRFKPSEVELLKAVSKDLSSPGELQLEYIDYGASPFAGNFTRQLELIASIGLHISGPGTAQGYSPLLADGSVHVNLGDRRSTMLGNVHHGVSFMEEVWSEGVPYIRALYYDPLRRQPVDYLRTELTTLIQRATDLARSNFKVPVTPGDNLSPIGQVFTEYCRAIGPGCDDLISLFNGYQTEGFLGVPDVQWCAYYAWAEQVVFESGGWSEAGLDENGKTTHCLLDRKRLRHIRARHLGW